MSSGVSFASRASSTTRRSSASNTGTIKYGTLLSSGATASYPTSFASSPQYNPATSSGGSNKLSGGTIAGIAVACVAFVFLIAFLVVLFVLRRRKANKRKRESTTALLPGPENAALGTHQPAMAQYPNYASTGVTGYNAPMTTTMPATPPPAAGAAPSQANRRNMMQSIPGLSFGSAGHRRTDSANSTTPFLAAGAVPDSPSRPSTGTSFDANRTPQSNRYSMESTTTYTGSPTMPNQNRFSGSHFGSTP